MTKNEMRLKTIIDKLKERKFDKSMQLATNITMSMFDFIPIEKPVKEAWRDTILEAIGEDEELESLFTEYAIESAVEDVVEGLGLKTEKGDIRNQIRDLINSLEEE